MHEKTEWHAGISLLQQVQKPNLHWKNKAAETSSQQENSQTSSFTAVIVKIGIRMQEWQYQNKLLQPTSLYFRKATAGKVEMAKLKSSEWWGGNVFYCYSDYNLKQNPLPEGKQSISADQSSSQTENTSWFSFCSQDAKNTVIRNVPERKWNSKHRKEREQHTGIMAGRKIDDCSEEQLLILNSRVQKHLCN